VTVTNPTGTESPSTTPFASSIPSTPPPSTPPPTSPPASPSPAPTPTPTQSQLPTPTPTTSSSFLCQARSAPSRYGQYRRLGLDLRVSISSRAGTRPHIGMSGSVDRHAPGQPSSARA